MKKKLSALILAGGLGTRLRTILPDVVKPMALVHGRPFLEWIMYRLVSFGIHRFVLCIGYRREQIIRHFGDGSRFGAKIVYSIEEEPLGTGGAIWNARSMIEGPFLVMNGDTYLPVDITHIVKFHRMKVADSGSAGTIVLARSSTAHSSGVVSLGMDQRILTFREKPKLPDASSWINAGVYLFEVAIFKSSPPQERFSLEYDVIPATLEQGVPIFGFPSEEEPVDIGTPEGYERIKVHPEFPGKAAQLLINRRSSSMKP
jgi:NDP-sugar pyrophosphorylase family protein